MRSYFGAISRTCCERGHQFCRTVIILVIAWDEASVDGGAPQDARFDPASFIAWVSRPEPFGATSSWVNLRLIIRCEVVQDHDGLAIMLPPTKLIVCPMALRQVASIFHFPRIAGRVALQPPLLSIRSPAAGRMTAEQIRAGRDEIINALAPGGPAAPVRLQLRVRRRQKAYFSLMLLDAKSAAN